MRLRPLLPVAAILVALLAGLAAGRFGGDDARDGLAVPGSAHTAVVQRVVDGDTVVLAGAGRVRLIGIDTPEVFGGAECFGPQASAFAKRWLTGRRVRYVVGREARDRYGRLLAYLWLPGGPSVNATLVARGYARTLTIPPNDRYADRFARLAAGARRRGAGLWGAGCGESWKERDRLSATG
jgi:micrococcal nuclease